MRTHLCMFFTHSIVYLVEAVLRDLILRTARCVPHTYRTYDTWRGGGGGGGEGGTLQHGLLSPGYFIPQHLADLLSQTTDRHTQRNWGEQKTHSEL